VSTPAVRGPGRPAAATRDDVLAVAIRRFAAGERIDVRAIAHETGVARATLYRWFGDRESLIGEAIVRMAAALFAEADRLADGHGGPGLLAAFDQTSRALAAEPALRRFLEHDRDVALRILTSSGGVVQPAFVRVASALIRREADAGRFHPTVDPDTLAYAVVRLTEAFLYNDAAVGIRGDIDRLREVQGALLGVRPGDRRRR
jgi:AcrR family transcriptional regulator